MGRATSLAIGFDFFLSAMTMCTAMEGWAYRKVFTSLRRWMTWFKGRLSGTGAAWLLYQQRSMPLRRAPVISA